MINLSTKINVLLRRLCFSFTNKHPSLLAHHPFVKISANRGQNSLLFSLTLPHASQVHTTPQLQELRRSGTATFTICELLYRRQWIRQN